MRALKPDNGVNEMSEGFGGDIGRSADADGPSPTVEPVPVSPVPASVPNADDVGRKAAQTLDVKDFEPFVRGVCDSIYDRLLNTVQNYLIDNSDMNIAGRISDAENRAARIHHELRLVDAALGVDTWTGTRAERINVLQATSVRYSELIYAVESMHKGETRHETALRYIRQAEGYDAKAMSASGQDPQGLEAKPASAVLEENLPKGTMT